MDNNRFNRTSSSPFTSKPFFMRKSAQSSNISHDSGCSGRFSSSNSSSSPPSSQLAFNIMSHMSSLTLQNNQTPSQNTIAPLQTLQQIQEAKPGNKRALLVDLPKHLYSIPALASFFEPYGEVAMLQILPQKRMWDSDLIDLLGATMCQRLSNQSLCALVEFHSARMAKFIIGILRKRLPTLKFRCALLKPSAAIELTNQAENLGLVNVVKLKSKQATSTPAKTDADSVIQTNDQSSTSSNQDTFSTSSSRSSISGEESGLDEMSSTGSSSGTNGHVCSQSLSVSSSSFSSSDSEGDSISSTTKNNHQRFVSSFKIKLGQQNINTDEISWRKE